MTSQAWLTLILARTAVIACPARNRVSGAIDVVAIVAARADEAVREGVGPLRRPGCPFGVLHICVGAWRAWLRISGAYLAERPPRARLALVLRAKPSAIAIRPGPARELVGSRRVQRAVVAFWAYSGRIGLSPSAVVSFGTSRALVLRSNVVVWREGSRLALVVFRVLRSERTVVS